MVSAAGLPRLAALAKTDLPLFISFITAAGPRLADANSQSNNPQQNRKGHIQFLECAPFVSRLFTPAGELRSFDWIAVNDRRLLTSHY
jgi:hypothetical protein